MIGAFAYRLGIAVGRLTYHLRRLAGRADRRLPVAVCPSCRMGGSWIKAQRAAAGRWHCGACGADFTLSPVAE